VISRNLDGLGKVSVIQKEKKKKKKFFLAKKFQNKNANKREE
jgi:hypothetical protein